MVDNIKNTIKIIMSYNNRNLEGILQQGNQTGNNDIIINGSCLILSDVGSGFIQMDNLTIGNTDNSFIEVYSDSIKINNYKNSFYSKIYNEGKVIELSQYNFSNGELASLILENERVYIHGSSSYYALPNNYGRNGQFLMTDGNGETYWKYPSIIKTNTTDIVANNSDTYILGIYTDCLTTPETIITFKGLVTKTAAGTASPIFNVRVGNNQSLSDAIIHQFVCYNQTAHSDVGEFEIRLVVRVRGLNGVSHASFRFNHRNTTTGFANVAQVQLIENTSNTYDNTGEYYIGLSVNPGNSASWTFKQIIITIDNFKM
jgi:hypothetical protein